MAELKDKNEQYSVFLKYKEQDNERQNKFIITLRLVLLTFIVVIITYFIMFLIDNYDNLVSIFENLINKNISTERLSNKSDLTPSKFNLKMLSRYQNILLLGVDSNGPDTLPFSGVRSDTMIILNIDTHGKSVNAISIPRDSKVYLADEHGIQKINAAYAIGGIELTKKTIEETLGIKIHNYIIVNAEGIRKLIDAIGGVPIHIDQNMHYRDYTAKLNIDFDKGYHVLNGAQAEEYLRFRKDMLGDIGRVHRQQKFIKALIEQIKSPEALRKIPDALKIASLYTRTDLNLYQMSQYAALARDVDMNKVEFVMLPGGPNKKGIISYWILDPEKTQKVINRLIYRKKTELSENEVSIGIMFDKSKEIDALNIREELKTLGFNVNCTGRSNQIRDDEIIGYNTQIPNDMIRFIQNNVPAVSHLKYVHNPVRNYCNTSDLVITLKSDDLI